MEKIICSVIGRFSRRQSFVIIVNNDAVSRHIDLSVWAVGVPKYGKLKQVMFTNESGYSVSPVEYAVNNGRLDITLPKTSAVVLERVE